MSDPTETTTTTMLNLHHPSLPAEALEVLAGTRRWAVVQGEALDLLRLLPSGCIDAVVTDPPYSSGGFTRGDRTMDPGTKYSKAEVNPQQTFGGDSRDQRAFAYWCALWGSEALRVAKAGAPIVQFTDWRQLPSTTESVQAAGWVWRGIFVWAKPWDSVRPQMGRFGAGAEFAVWGTKGPGLDSKDVGCLPGWVACSSPRGEERLHLTAKPEKVMETVVGICVPGGLVLDPFGGSGTTAVAALTTGRRCLLFEQDPAYAATARDRLAALEQGLRLKDARAGQMSLLGAQGLGSEPGASHE